MIGAVISRGKDTASILKGELKALIHRAVVINGDSLINDDQLDSIVTLFSLLAEQRVAFPIKELQDRANDANANLRAISLSLASIHTHIAAKE